jgi:uncharacterized membrane protein
MPASLHDELVEAAGDEGVSLNQFICCVLAGGVNWRRKGLEAAEKQERADREGMRQRRRAEMVDQMWRDLIG